MISRVLLILVVSGFRILYILSPEFWLYPTDMQVSTQSPIFGVILVCSLTTPALPHMRSFDTNFGMLPIQCSYCVAVFLSHVTTVNPSSNIAVCKASLHTLYLILNDKFEFLIIYCALPPIVENPTSAR